MTASRTARLFKGGMIYLTIVLVTLLIVDGLCIAFGLFPPRLNYGDAELGWRPAAATGRMALGRCTEFSTGATVHYVRNEDGVRATLTRSQSARDSSSVKIAVTGDSQTDLCVPNSQLHSGVLESELIRMGIPAIALPYGSGRYSPLQDYLALPVDSALIRTLSRLPLTYGEGARQEGELYDRLRSLAVEQGWLFVDNLSALKAYRGSDRLYNNFDYHLLPAASELVGRAQAAVLMDALRTKESPVSTR